MPMAAGVFRRAAHAMFGDDMAFLGSGNLLGVPAPAVL